MVRDEIAKALESTFPDAVLQWQDSELHIDAPIHVDAPILDSPAERPTRRAREVVLRFDPDVLARLATRPPLERAQSLEILEKRIEDGMATYDDGRDAPADARLDPFTIRCGDFLID
jgi:hypothetical protein